jgi:hypothetical protein
LRSRRDDNFHSARPPVLIPDDLAHRKTQPSRALLVGRLRRFEKALRRLRDECRRSADLMHDFLLHDTLEYVGRSLTFSAMGEALGKNVMPRNFDEKIKVKRSVGERITLEFMEEFTLSRKQQHKGSRFRRVP